MLNYIPKNLILTILIIFFVVVLFSFFTFYISIKPGKWPIQFTPESFDLEYEDINFKSSDGIKLKGWFLPSISSNNTIIVMHGYPTNKADVLPFSMFLLDRYNVFLFDFRSFGESEGKYTTVGYKEVKDLDGAVNYLRKRDDVDNIGVLGFSLGGAVAIMNENVNVKAIVSDSAYSSLNNMVEVMYKNFYFLKYPFIFMTRVYGRFFFGIDLKDVSPANAIKNINKPILIIHGTNDKQIPVDEAYILYSANKKNDLWIVENADHGATYALNKEAYEKRVFKFFEKNLE